MKIGAGGQPEDLLKDERQSAEPEPEDDKKPSLGERFERFWYFYKWQTIIAVILIFGIGISVFQLIQNTEPDAYVMYIGPGYLSASEKKTMMSAAEKYLDDYNGDGKKYLSILDITAAVGKDVPYTAYQTNNDAVTRFNLEITTGDSVIYLVEESFYEALLNFGVLAKLSDIIDADLIPDNTYDKYGVRVSELDFFGQNGFSSVPGETILCIRQPPEADSLTYGRTAEYWNSNLTLFKNMFSYRLPQGETHAGDKIFDVSPFDAVMMYIGYDRIHETTQKALSEAAAAYLTDADNSKSKDLGIDYRVLKPSDDVSVSAYGVNADDAKYFENQISSGNDVIFLVEKSFYDELYGTGLILPLKTVFSYRDAEGNIVEVSPDVKSEDGYGVRVSDLDFFGDISGFDAFDDNLIICLRDKPEGCDTSYYNSCVGFFRNILNYKTPAR